MDPLLILSFSIVIVRHKKAGKFSAFLCLNYSDGHRVKKVNYYWLILGSFSSI